MLRYRAAMRFTPARAGRTRDPCRGRGRCPVHPRTRGEDSVSALRSLASYGSPPHARGGHPGGDNSEGRVRFTPARAGRTRSARTRRPTMAVHPRTRGEDKGRGADQAVPRLGGARFTPARAGKTGTRASTRCSRTVHPRTRGEDFPSIWSVCVTTGSPPHARGRRQDVVDEEVGQRFTPARAGKTSASLAATSVTPVHPRTRGEDFDSRPETTAKSGSPPHARGRRGSSPPRRTGRRFTPARAGKTPSPQR